jgi:hypothetical protein
MQPSAIQTINSESAKPVHHKRKKMCASDSGNPGAVHRGRGGRFIENGFSKTLREYTRAFREFQFIAQM